jgi:formate dehydrogenase assembly factor FdhD
MNGFSVRRRIRRSYAAGESQEVEDDIVKESRLLIRLDKKDFIQAVLTPSQVVEFVVGFLRTRGLIQTMQDIDRLEVKGEVASVTRNPALSSVFPDLRVLDRASAC